ncbi:MAG: tetratricopeptide repeat protein [Solirubrobacteraceae bacterium]
MKAWQRVHLDELPDLPGPGSLRWRPVRMTLDAHAFGCNAYTALEAGVDVVEPHTEETFGHEELYFVHAGSARFTLDGETFDAPAGTYVHLPEPKVHRHAVALEPGTTVLSFGGPSSFEPSRWEWTFRAGALRQAGDGAGAREVLDDARRRFPDSGEVLYELACLEATEGDPETAWTVLEEAIRLRPEVARWARDDEELAEIVSRLPPEERS